MYSQPAALTQTRAFAQAWPEEAFVQGVLAQMPWYHQLALLDKLQTPKERSDGHPCTNTSTRRSH